MVLILIQRQQQQQKKKRQRRRHKAAIFIPFHNFFCMLLLPRCVFFFCYFCSLFFSPFALLVLSSAFSLSTLSFHPPNKPSGAFMFIHSPPSLLSFAFLFFLLFSVFFFVCAALLLYCSQSPPLLLPFEPPTAFRPSHPTAPSSSPLPPSPSTHNIMMAFFPSLSLTHFTSLLSTGKKRTKLFVYVFMLFLFLFSCHSSTLPPRFASHSPTNNIEFIYTWKKSEAVGGSEGGKKIKSKSYTEFYFFAGAAVASCRSLNMMMGVVEVERCGGERERASEELCDAWRDVCVLNNNKAIHHLNMCFSASLLMLFAAHSFHFSRELNIMSTTTMMMKKKRERVGKGRNGEKGKAAAFARSFTSTNFRHYLIEEGFMCFYSLFSRFLLLLHSCVASVIFPQHFAR